jgi:hypothetical protein
MDSIRSPILSVCERSGLIHQTLTASVIGAFFDVYNALRYGLLESVYAAALVDELVGAGTPSSVRCSSTPTTRANLSLASAST